MQDFTTFICYQMKTTMKKVEKHIAEFLSQYGLTMTQSFILFSLLEKDGSTLTEIGLRTQIDNSSLTAMVDKLEKQGLVERRLSTEDRRVVTLYLTPQGREVGKQIYSAGERYHQMLLKNIHHIESEFYEGLNIISNLLDQKRERSGTK
ncbi:MAG TPA: MarR family transcriptional regulator [Syntrophomonadaceae bacterium]|nr:MarR family transcriptional regulator [Syntrophomonadaceae bacterium]